MKNIGLLGLFLGMSVAAFASGVQVAPEVDGSTAAAAVALVAGGLLVLRSRKK
ncbi:MAG: hypothetical protein ABI811_11940 [Acidobacteriota bacterium]